MPKVLIVTNDFPPRSGGIQSFVHSLALGMAAGSVVVYAPAWPGAAEFDAKQPFPVVRHRTSLMLPVPGVARRARQILIEHACDTVLFGAAAPLGLLGAGLRKAGAARIVALTHGHEAGWAALPGARFLLRKIGEYVDVVTYLGEYFRIRIVRGLSPSAAAKMVRLAPGVDNTVFRPGVGGAAIRSKLGIAADIPVVVCVSRIVPRKGQDTLIRAWPRVLAGLRSVSEELARPGVGARMAGPGTERSPDPLLLIVGAGKYADKLKRLAQRLHVADSVIFTGSVPWEDLPAYYDAGNVFAMPCRTRHAGLDVEGLGIVYLEASATGLPVIGGDSGGAPDAILPGETGYVVKGGDDSELADRLIQLLGDPDAAAAMGDKGLAWIDQEWRWDLVSRRLAEILSDDNTPI
ncbi:MAG TPA: glycosyltransferase family 4 protein [Streptosporangiaceae bacterium]|jgi:phosphatidylinositol alpha-1,6-mannosyltransferase